MARSTGKNKADAEGKRASKKSGGKAETKKKRTPRTRKPDGLSLEEWQIALRRQDGRDQEFRLENIGEDAVFSEFAVENAETGGNYRVAIRGAELGDNFCSCPDFSVNTLGTCKHIEFVLRRLQEKPKNRKALQRGFEPAYSEVYLRYGAKREVAFRPGAGCPVSVKRLAAKYFDEQGILRRDAYAVVDRFLALGRKNGHDFRCYEDALSYIARVRDNTRRSKKIDEAASACKDPRFPDSLLKLPLYPYQREGALFAARAGRTLIADDMGLGKTAQAIAAVEILAETAGVERVLIVSPVSLKHQWKAEIERFTGRSTEVIQGPFPARSAGYASESFYKITNYEVIRRDADLIRAWAPDLIILDEAQRIKNWDTQTARSVKRLSSDYAVVLTGTPIENRLEELLSIVQFVDRFRLGPSFRFLAEHRITDDHGKTVGYRNLSKIAESLEPILVRRTKEEVLSDLPERLEKRYFVEMTKEQREHHDENRDRVARIVSKWRKHGFLSEMDQRMLMIALQNMRMSCNSTYLLDQDTDHGTKAREFLSLMEDILENPDSKVVVFSQWVRTHEILIRRIEEREWDYVFFHGGVPGPRRKELIDRFKKDPACRLFLSTDAGGVGLNLQSADAVVIMDQPWNPAVLEQRIGRVHRLGQRRAVRVVHFIAQGTIEEGMLSLISFKKSMFSGVLDGGKDEVFLGETRLKRFMKTVEQATGSIPESAPPSEPTGAEEVAESKAAASGHSESTPAASWEEVLGAGLSFLEKLGDAVAAARGPSAGGTPRISSTGGPLVEKDPATGRSYVKFPLPEPDTLTKIGEILSRLTGGK